MNLFIVLWIIIAISTVAAILLLTHLFGKEVFDVTEKIYKEFTEESVEKINSKEKEGEKEI